MKRIRVKICGITRLEDLYVSVDAGVDAVGFIVDVPSSLRSLTLRKAKVLMDKTPIFVEKVAVTVFRSIDQLNRIYGKLKPDAVQIHGDQLPENAVRESLRHAQLIRAVQVNSENSIDAAIRSAIVFDAVLTDSFSPGKYGGTGTSHNWALSKLIKESIKPKPLILAGGLKPENVKDAILTVEPYAVDVSSGVEVQPGIKDSEMIFSFMEEVKEAERCVNLANIQ